MSLWVFGSLEVLGWFPAFCTCGCPSTSLMSDMVSEMICRPKEFRMTGLLNTLADFFRIRFERFWFSLSSKKQMGDRPCSSLDSRSAGGRLSCSDFFVDESSLLASSLKVEMLSSCGVSSSRVLRFSVLNSIFCVGSMLRLYI